MNQVNQALQSHVDDPLRITGDDLPPSVVDVPPAVTWAIYGNLTEGGAVQKLTIAAQPFSVGRHSENVVTVSDPTVSGYHAELVLAGEQLLVRDRNSTNGTLLNGRRIQTVEGLRDGDILHFGNVMFTVHRENTSIATETIASDAAGNAIAQVQFSTFLNRPGVEAHFQPIVRLDSLETVGFEVLSRSQFIGLETPDKMFKVAAQRTSEAELSRVCRIEGLRFGSTLGHDVQIYLNTHPAELNDQELFTSLHDLREQHPQQSIVLEVHESGVTSVEFLKSLRDVLTELDFGLAYDDFGSGQARLAELIEVPPDVLKFDVKLIQGLPTASESRRSTVAGLIRIVEDLNVVPLAEGIVTQEESDICCELGFKLAQGYLFGRPAPARKWACPQ
ncbi:MAG: EAL domain-containing protein [Fuerstiella sp.]|nr:EAL domain-containing protein [Fuerstiella sp.]MCP4853684.1 EAL domain-containing protein [Fuerstiella sp.]